MSQRDGRRVKSTGDEAEQEGANLSQPLQRRREGGGERVESSMFYAKPVRVRKHRPTHRAAARNTGTSMEGRFGNVRQAGLNHDLHSELFGFCSYDEIVR